MIRKVIAVLLAALMLFAVTACSSDDATDDTQDYTAPVEDDVTYFKAEENNPYNDAFTYEYIDSTSIRIVSHTDSKELHELVIPSEMNGKTVLAIADNAFRYNSSLSSVTIPASVTEIGNFAFAECSQLKSVTLPAGILSQKEVDDVIEELGYAMFYHCTSLETVTFTGDPSLDAIPNSMFQGCEKLANITIPSTVQSIGTGAFFACKSLTSLVIPEGVTAIGDQAFMNCSGLESIAIPAQTNYIGKSAFCGCDGMESATFAETQNWAAYTGTDDTAEDPESKFTPLNVTDPAKAADMLTDTYTVYIWTIIVA